MPVGKHPHDRNEIEEICFGVGCICKEDLDALVQEKAQYWGSGH